MRYPNHFALFLAILAAPLCAQDASVSLCGPLTPCLHPRSAPASTAVLPQFAVGGGFVTDFYVVNSSISNAAFSISFFDDSGSAVVLPFANGVGNLSTLSGSIPPGGSAFYEAGTPQGSPLTGSAVITAGPAITVQELFRREADGQYYEAAVPAVTGTDEILVPFDDTTFSANGDQIYTGLAIANLSSTVPANVMCTAKDSTGTVIPGAITVPTLNQLGHWSDYLFPAMVGLRGTIYCTSDTPIAAVGIRALGTNAISSLPVVPFPLSNPGGTKVLPHLTVGDSFVTDFYIVNSSITTSTFSISFYDDNGNTVFLPFANGVGSLSTLSGSIPPGGAAFYEAGTAGGPPVSGSAVISSDPSITVQGLFRREVNGQYYEAAVPVSSGSIEVEVPFDDTTFTANGSQIYTGLAIMSLSTSVPANVSCTANDSTGKVVPNAITVPMLNMLGHWANYLFPALIGVRGTLYCTSDTPIGAIGIRALGDNTISSLPVITK
jgi:hypothetical protein